MTMTTTHLSPTKRALLREAQRQELATLEHREHVARVKANPAKALRALKDAQRRRQANLLDPKWQDQKRKFPKWKPGMTTAEYIALYVPSCTQRIVTYSHRRYGCAPWNGPLDEPEVVQALFEGVNTTDDRFWEDR